MKDSQNKQLGETNESEDNEKKDEESALKKAMYISVIFVGGGIAFFWLVLFLTYSARF